MAHAIQDLNDIPHTPLCRTAALTLSLAQRIRRQTDGRGQFAFGDMERLGQGVREYAVILDDAFYRGTGGTISIGLDMTPLISDVL